MATHSSSVKIVLNAVLLFVACSCFGIPGSNASSSSSTVEICVGEVLVNRLRICNAGSLGYVTRLVKKHSLFDVSPSNEAIMIPLDVIDDYYTFIWRNGMKVSETCCWSIVNPIITCTTVTPGNNNYITEVEDVGLCQAEQQTFFKIRLFFVSKLIAAFYLLAFRFSNSVKLVSILMVLGMTQVLSQNPCINNRINADTNIDETSTTSSSVPVLVTTSEISSVTSTATSSDSETSSSVPVSVTISEISSVTSAATSSDSETSSSVPVSVTTSEISSITSTATSSDSETSSSVPVLATTSKMSNSVSAPSPTSLKNTSIDIVCPEEGVWNAVTANTIVFQVGVCYNGTVNATRYCGSNGEWEDPHCLVTQQFTDIMNQIQESTVEGLTDLGRIVLEPSRNITLFQARFLLDLSLETVLINNVSLDNFTNSFHEAASNTIQEANININDEESRRSLGSQLLLTLDNFVLNFVESSEEVIGFDKVILIRALEFDELVNNTHITGISVDGNSITLPPQILRQPNNTEPVRIGSILYRNLSYLLPPGNISGIIVSPVISSTTDSPISDLEENVTIQLQTTCTEMASTDGTILCVFFQYESQSTNQPTGDWSTSGCTTTVNGYSVTCSCNHLTHYAILLSPGIETSPVHYDILSTIGLVLVPISLLCMILVILTYTLMRSLWSLRNYIHIMLCFSLFMAQLVFMIGIDMIKNKGACSAVAVILQYLFLVTFMWLLMEGVVLVITFVKVFISRQKNYIIGFTVTSYVVPAVYMALVVPIGYSVNTDEIPDNTHYLLYNGDQLTACWLNYKKGFIWSFIVPVAIILMVNIGIFVITVIIIRRNSRSRGSKNKSKTTLATRWMKALIPLTLVMGINWLVGLLAFREELLFVAYIMTIFIAGQGIILFIILVPLSNQVRDAYLEIWIKWKSRSKLVKRLSITNPTFWSNSSFSKDDTLKSTLRLKNAADCHVGAIPESGLALSLEGYTLRKKDQMTYKEATIVISNPVRYEGVADQKYQYESVTEQNQYETTSTW